MQYRQDRYQPGQGEEKEGGRRVTHFILQMLNLPSPTLIMC